MALEKEQFFENLASQGIAITFDDVRIVTGEERSHVKANETDISTQITKNETANSPIISAAMSTVTMAEMAITVAIEGGYGTIPASLSVDQQRKEVRKVKKFMTAYIDEPITVGPDYTIERILKDKAGYDQDFSTFPVVDTENRLLGILTSNDFAFTRTELTNTASQIMTPVEDIVVVNRGTKYKKAYEVMKDNKKKTLPVINSKTGKLVGLYLFSDVARMVEEDKSMYNLDERGRLKVAAAVPTDPLEAVIRMKALEKYADLIVIDSSQGDHDYTFETLIAMKEAGATKDIMAGNVDNPKAALLLAEAGADGIKVGKGGGSICSTRPNLGIGTPQVTAVYECAKAVDRLDVPVCSDGGITNNGDIAIALAVGAKTVMMGNMFAGTDEAPGEVRTLSDQTKWKVYRGEGSLEALQENASSRQRYNQSAKGEVIAPQGVSGLVPYKGSASEICKLSIAYLRQTMSHTNCQNLEEFNRKTKLWRVTNAGLHESRVHDVAVN